MNHWCRWKRRQNLWSELFKSLNIWSISLKITIGNQKTTYRKTNLGLSRFIHWNGTHERNPFISFSTKLYELLIDKHCWVHGRSFCDCFSLVSRNFHRLVIKRFFVEWNWTYEINIKKVNALFGGAFRHVRKRLTFSKMKNLLERVEQEHYLQSNPIQEKTFVNIHSLKKRMKFFFYLVESSKLFHQLTWEIN